MQIRKFILHSISLLALFIVGVSCSAKNNDENKNIATNNYTNNENDKIVQYKLEIIDTLKHNPGYYTQGLVIHSGKLYEGTGQLGESRLVRFNLKNFNLEKNIALNDNYFGEGITILKDKIYQLTWLNQICLVYDLKTMKQTNEFSYSGEGWGITNNDSLLFLSDGSSVIRVINPKNFTTNTTLKITKNNNPVRFINELELVDSLLYANIYMQDLIIIANINTGKVVGEINISELRRFVNSPRAEVSNGIAYDKENKVFYLTGKYWDKIFIVKFIPI